MSAYPEELLNHHPEWCDGPRFHEPSIDAETAEAGYVEHGADVGALWLPAVSRYRDVTTTPRRGNIEVALGTTTRTTGADDPLVRIEWSRDDGHLVVLPLLSGEARSLARLLTVAADRLDL